MTQILQEAFTEAPQWVSVLFYGSWAGVGAYAFVQALRKAPVIMASLLTASAIVLPYAVFS